MMNIRIGITVAVLSCTSLAFGHQFRFQAPLTGLDELPANNSLGVGTALVTVDEDELTLRIQISFESLVGNVTGANIFAATGEALGGTAIPAFQDDSNNPAATILPDFPLGEMSGEYDRTLNLAIESTYDPVFVSTYGGSGFDRVSKSVSALIAALEERTAYLEIMTSAYTSGEIRGFPVYVLGDFNNNGVVDAADYTVWRDSLGETGEGLDADSNNSNSIDLVDYEAWRDNFGHTRFDPGSGDGSDGIAGVPEPGGLVLIQLAALLVCAAKRGRAV